MLARFPAAISVMVALAAAWALAVPAAHADAVADFYKGRQLNLIVGYGPGGGYDIYARLLARHFGRFIPGHPNVVVQNMPGAGSLRAVNYLNKIAPKDGTAVAMFSRNMPLIGLLGGNSNAQFDPRKFTWLGSSSSFLNDAYILIVRKDAPVKSIDEARRADLPPLVLGGTAEGATGNDVPIILRDTIGLHVKQVVGYPDIDRDLPRDRARRGPWPHRRPVVGEIGEARMAQAGQRLSRARPVRASDPPPGFPRRADGARAREERGGARADRAGGAALSRCRGRSRPRPTCRQRAQGAAAGFPREYIAIRNIWKRPPAADRREPDRRRRGAPRDRPHRQRAAGATRIHPQAPVRDQGWRVARNKRNASQARPGRPHAGGDCRCVQEGAGVGEF